MSKSTPRTFQPQAVERLHELTGTPLANFGPRAAAFLIDMLLVCVIVVAGDVVINRHEIIQANQDIKIDVNPFHGFGVAVLLLYFAMTLYWGKGRTLGKRLLRIRVVSLVHHRMSFWHCVERTLGYGASLLEGGFGFIQFFIHPNRQTAHDRLAETIVIRVPRPVKAVSRNESTAQE